MPFCLTPKDLKVSSYNSQPFSYIYIYSKVNDIVICTEWCTIISLEDNKTHSINSKDLETETCEFVTDSDLYEGNELIWKCKGVPYTVEVKEVHGE